MKTELTEEEKSILIELIDNYLEQFELQIKKKPLWKFDLTPLIYKLNEIKQKL